MSKALSVDLRVRVVAGVASGMSHREAAALFGVSAASVSRWRALDREQGSVAPKALGGDRRSGRIDGHKDLIMATVEETPDLTLEELRRVLAGQGFHFGYGTLQRFFKRHKITRKKRRPMPASRTART